MISTRRTVVRRRACTRYGWAPGGVVAAPSPTLLLALPLVRRLTAILVARA
jgi:hypothetical protein